MITKKGTEKAKISPPKTVVPPKAKPSTGGAKGGTGQSGKKKSRYEK
jgi:hypothetical protein